MIVTDRGETPCATSTRSCSIRLDGIRTGFRTLFAARCNHSVQIDLWTTTPNSCFIRLIDIREDQLDPSLSSLQSFEAELAQQSVSYNRYSVYHRKRTGLTPTRQHSGRPAGSVPQVTGVTPSKFSKTSIRNRTDSGSKPTRTISGEPTGCTPTKFVVNSEPSLVNRNRIRWHQHPAHRK